MPYDISLERIENSDGTLEYRAFLRQEGRMSPKTVCYFEVGGEGIMAFEGVFIPENPTDGKYQKLADKAQKSSDAEKFEILSAILIETADRYERQKEL